MLGIIITSHGNLCEEIKKTVEMFSGKIDNCYTLPLIEGQSIEDFELKMDGIINKFDSNDDLIIISDLRGGTPYNIGIKNMFGRSNTWVLTGMNVPMILSVVMRDGNCDTDELMSVSLDHSIEGIEVKSNYSRK